MAVYNGESYVKETIHSILSQTVSDFEYIIIDDASTDNSVDFIQAFQDPRIRLIRNQTNLRLVATRNIGLSAARGKYVALIDHDDLAMPNRFEEQLKVLEADPSLILTGSWAQNIDAHGKPLPLRVLYSDTPEQSRIRLLFRNQFVNSTLMFRRLDCQDIRYRPEFPLSEDYDFIVQLSTFGRVSIIQKILVKYRIHNANYSGLMNEEMVNLSREVKRRQVERLGVEPSANDLDVHAVFEYRQDYYMSGLLPLVAAWVGQLMTANECIRLYDQRDFLHVAYSELAMAAEFASRKDKELIQTYVSPMYLRAFLRHPAAAARILLKLSLGLK
jgi:glycosyltransferase involved in cell wall biosynthesis